MTLVFNRNFDEEQARESGGQKNCACGKPDQKQVEALIEAATAQGYQTGVQEGHKKALAEFRAESDQAQSEALTDIQARLRSLSEKMDHHNAALEAQILDFTLSICEQVFPYLQQTQTHERALTQIRKTMRLALNSPTITILLSPDALPKLTPFIEQITTELGLTEQVKLSADAKLKDGATIVEWQNGFMDYSFDAVCERILTALKAAQASIPSPLINGSEQSA